MRSTNIKNKPVDRRYLSDQDKSDYNQGAYQARARAVGRTRAYRGNRAYETNRPIAAQTRTPGSGGFTVFGTAQQDRNREIGAQNQRMESLKPDKVKDVYKDIYS